MQKKYKFKDLKLEGSRFELFQPFKDPNNLIDLQDRVSHLALTIKG